MRQRIAIYLARRGLENASARSLSQSKHVDRAMYACFQRLNRVILVANRRCRAGQVIDIIDLDVEWKGYVVSQRLKSVSRRKMFDIAAPPCEVVIDTKNLVASGQQ